MTFSLQLLLGLFLSRKEQKYIGEIKEEDANSAATGCFVAGLSPPKITTDEFLTLGIAAGIYGVCCIVAAIGYWRSSRQTHKELYD